MILYFVALANEALFVLFSHVLEEFIFAERAFPTELAKGMYASVDLFFGRSAVMIIPLYGW